MVPRLPDRRDIVTTQHVRCVEDVTAQGMLNGLFYSSRLCVVTLCHEALVHPNIN